MVTFFKSDSYFYTITLKGAISLNKREKGWGIVILIIVLLGYVLPYTIFKGMTHWYGSFLVWTLLALIIIVINFIITSSWRDKS